MSLLKYGLIVIVILATILSAMLWDVVAHRRVRPAGPQSSTQDQPVAQTKAAIQTYHGLPVRLSIPAIDVDAAVEYMSINDKGEMAAPSTASNVGWYKFGALPGDAGSSVIAGHVLGRKGEPGIFQHLDKLRKGDQIRVLDGRGQIIAFTVREAHTYGATEQPREVFNSNDGLAHLNLITCAGEWDARQKLYLKRLVLFADASS